jgi:glyoxylase-like metal-dependent hydrolase (beta-lactamase superfamily II)
MQRQARIMLELGDFKIWTLCDGYLDIDTEVFFGPGVEKKRVRIPVNSFLIDTGSNLILVDAGSGNYFGPNGGGLEKALNESGHDLNEVSSVLLTHLHPDHIAGLPLFPQVKVFVSRKEFDYWSDEKNLSERNKRYYPFVKKTLEPCLQRIIQIEPEEILFPGITAVSAYGHTPGHIGFFIESKSKKVFLCGDLCSDMQLDCLDRVVVIDADPKTAVLSRLTLFSQKAKEGFLIGGAHITGFI